ncbi:MAG: hypothetical protein QM756_11310 [Polyangiaceae bacterium]
MVVGMGNVALDVVRILAKPPDQLANTDIADYALRQLRASKVREIWVLGRRGPAQAAFDAKELADIAELDGVDVFLDGEVSLAEPAQLDPHEHVHIQRNLQFLATLPRAPRASAERRVRLRFLAAPKALIGEGGRVSAIDIEQNQLVEAPNGNVEAKGTGRVQRLSTGLVVRSIGYRATPINGLPFDAQRSLIPNHGGMVGLAGEPIARCYVVGWIKRGPVGLLGTNKQDAKETVEAMLGGIPEALAGRPSRTPGSLANLLEQRGARVLSYSDWQRIDERERERGAAHGKIREKFASVASLLDAAEKGPAA